MHTAHAQCHMRVLVDAYRADDAAARVLGTLQLRQKQLREQCEAALGGEARRRCEGQAEAGLRLGCGEATGAGGRREAGGRQGRGLRQRNLHE